MACALILDGRIIEGVAEVGGRNSERRQKKKHNLAKLKHN